MEYKISKKTLPKGESYPVKISMLDAAFKEAGLTMISHVNFFQGRGNDVLHAHFRFGKTGAMFVWGEGAEITIYSVPSNRRSARENLILSEALPPLIKWLKSWETEFKKAERISTVSTLSQNLFMEHVNGKLISLSRL